MCARIVHAKLSRRLQVVVRLAQFVFDIKEQDALLEHQIIIARN